MLWFQLAQITKILQELCEEQIKKALHEFHIFYCQIKAELQLLWHFNFILKLFTKPNKHLIIFFIFRHTENVIPICSFVIDYILNQREKITIIPCLSFFPVTRGRRWVGLGDLTKYIVSTAENEYRFIWIPIV